MSYAVDLVESVVKEIVGWNLSSHLQREFLRGLDELGSDPNRLLIRVGPPIDALQHDLVVHEPGIPGRDHLFTFTVLYAADEETLHVVACDHYHQDRTEPR